MLVFMRFCSVVAIALLVFVHLGPAKWQPPRTGLGWQLDHFLGYCVVTSIVWLAWPRRPLAVGGALMAASPLLEALQAFTPDRHADFYAALFGAGGALTVALFAELLIQARRRRAALTDEAPTAAEIEHKRLFCPDNDRQSR